MWTTIKFVINFDYPSGSEDYVNHIGHTPRAVQLMCETSEGYHSRSEGGKTADKPQYYKCQAG